MEDMPCSNEFVKTNFDINAEIGRYILEIKPVLDDNDMIDEDKRYLGSIDGHTSILSTSFLGKPLSLHLNGMWNIKNTTSIEATGFIDQWPAFSSKRLLSSNQIVLTNDKNLVVLSERETKLPNIVPKPKFLEYLERYINKQLKKHGAESVEPNPMRLEIYREAFDWLTDAFKTYKPLFADIKREYDSMISFLRQEIRNLEPMKEMIWTISEERNQEILRIKKLEKEEITDLKAEKVALMKIIGEMEASEKTLEIQISTLQKKLEEEHLAYRNEADARRLLIIDINDIKQQMEDIYAMKKNQEIQSDDDPVITKIALEEAKKSHSELLVELTRMRTDYSDVVPKRDFEKLAEDYNQLSNSSTENARKLLELDTEQQVIEEKCAALHQQRDFYYSKYMELARSSTPRPDWKRCGDVLARGHQWWKEYSKDRSSGDIMELLLQEINLSGSVKQQVDGKGLDSAILPFLRVEGKVNLRSLSKRDVKIHIREIWDGRKLLKEEQSLEISKNKEFVLPPMGDYIDLFFKKTYGIEKIRQEWAYSFYEYISKEKNDEKIIQFMKILTGEINEEAYWDEMIFLEELMEKLLNKDTENRNLIAKEDMKSVLESISFNSPDEESIVKQMDLIDKELETADDKYLPYNNLFMIDDEGEFGPFLSEMIKSFNEDKKRYVREIETEISELGFKINAKQLKNCIQIVDPGITEEILNKYVLMCFDSKSLEEANKIDQLPVEILIQKLRICSAKRFGSKI